ncbi:MAG: PKD domain-containing protein [Bacteroidia bacterium]
MNQTATFKRIAAICLCLIFYQNLRAQTYSFWPFTSGALDFSTDPPTVVKNPYFDNHTHGPMLCIADSAGKPLFSSDRSGIFNKYAKFMDSAIYIHIMNPRQGMVAFPSLQNQGNYIFVFCGEKSHGGRPGSGLEDEDFNTLAYYEIDPRLKNDSGNVTQKYFTHIDKRPFSKITLVRKEDGYWVVGRYKEDIYAFPYTKDGFGSAIKSRIGSKNLDGNLKASHDGKYFVECGGSMYHYDFDLKTGKFTNEELIDSIANYHAYDVAFSPNDSLFYVIEIKNVSSAVKLMQYQRYSKNHLATKLKLFMQDYYLYKGYREHVADKPKDTLLPWGIQFSGSFSGIQLAPNGKIYFVCAPNAQENNPERQFLGEITYPNKIGFDCKINPRCFPLQFYQLRGLPFTFYDPGKFPRFSYQLSCNSINLKNESHASFTKFTWYFSDGDSLYKEDFSDVSHQYKEGGKFRVRLKAQTDNGYTTWFSDSVYYIPNSVKSIAVNAQDSISCQYTLATFYAQINQDTVNAKTGATFTWNFGDGNTKVVKNDSVVSYVYTKTGIYNVSLKYFNGFCTQNFILQKAINIIPAPKPGFTVSQTEGCAPLTVAITDKAEGNINKRWYTLGNGNTDSSANTSAIYTRSGKYLIIQNLLSENGCHTQDSVYVRVYNSFSADDSVSILNVSVKDNKPYIHWQKNTSVKNYRLQRKAENQTFFTSIATLNDTNSYVDENAEVQILSYTYRIEAEDSCGNIIQRGRIGKTIHLRATEYEEKYILVSWNTYKDWPNGAEKYTLFNHADTNEWQPLVSRADTLFLHSGYAQSGQTQACYYVQAKSKNDTFNSFSNRLCLPLKPVFWIPNAFTPNNDGLNDVFKVFAVGVSAFEMHIITRDNGHVFSGYSLDEGWDGKFKGKRAPQEEYVYIIKALTKDGYIYRKGFVMLLAN